MDSYGMTFKGPMILASEAEGPYVDIRSYNTFLDAVTDLNNTGEKVTLYITQDSTLTLNTSANIHLRVAPNCSLSITNANSRIAGGISFDIDGYMELSVGADVWIGKKFFSPSMNYCLRGSQYYDFEWGAVPYVDVTWFGAEPNTTDDSSAAINNAFECVKGVNGYLSIQRRDLPVYFPPGTYYCDSSVFAGSTTTSANSNSVRTIYGIGATLLGTCSNQPVFDYTGGRLGRFYGLNVYGDSTDIPSCGILLARKDQVWTAGQTAAASNSENVFRDVSVKGAFVTSGVHNYGSTNNFFDNLRVELDGGSAKACVILDGENYYAITSPNTSISGTSLTINDQTCEENTFSNCYFSNIIDAPSISTRALVNIHNSCMTKFESTKFYTTANDHPVIWLSGEYTSETDTSWTLSVDDCSASSDIETFLYVGRHDASHPGTAVSGVSIKNSNIDVKSTGHLLKTDAVVETIIRELEIDNVSGANLNIRQFLTNSVIAAANIQLLGTMTFTGYFEGKITTESRYHPNFSSLARITGTLFFSDIGQYRNITGGGGSPFVCSQRTANDGFLRLDGSVNPSATVIERHFTTVNGSGTAVGPKAPSGTDEDGWSLGHMAKINVSYPTIKNIAISSITWAASTVSVVMASNPFEVDTSVQIEDVSPVLFNGNYKVLTADATTITYTLNTAPSATTGTGGKASGYKFYYIPMYEAVPATT